MVAGATALDLAQHKSLRGNKKAIAAVTGVISGMGSLCGALIQVLIPHIGHSNLFLMQMGLCLCGALLLAPLGFRDLRDLLRQRRESRQKRSSSTFSHKSVSGIEMKDELVNSD